MLQIRKARPAEAEALAELSKRVFDDDVNYGAPGPGGPPGYDSASWQARMMRLGDYWAIREAGELIGGMIVFRKAPGEYELGRIFIAPEAQNRGLGAEALAFLDEAYLFTRRWTLGTPQWNRRTRHFYQKVGYAEIGEDAHGGVLFERRRAGPGG
jgi:RimJ/RimL family protein N-acetyltransferase